MGGGRDMKIFENDADWEERAWELAKSWCP